MKKLFSIIAIGALFIVGAQAQKVSSASLLVGGAFGNTIDTLDDAETITKFIKVQFSQSAMSMQVVITKISGTVGGTVTITASNDGVNFVDISSPSIAISALRPVYSDTLLPADVTTNTKIWTIPLNGSQGTNVPTLAPYLYYGIKYVGAGTMSAKFEGFLVFRTRKGGQ